MLECWIGWKGKEWEKKREGRGKSWKEENYDEAEGKEEEKMGKERVKDS